METHLQSSSPIGPTTAGSIPQLPWTAKLAIAGPLTFCATSLAAWLVQTHYNPIRQTVSELGALDAQHRWIITIGFVMAAIGPVALAALVRQSFRSGRGSIIVPVLLLLVGVSTLAAGLSPLDMGIDNPLYAGLEAANGFSDSHNLHNLVSMPVFLGMAFTPLFAVRRFRRDDRFTSLVRLSRWTSVVCLVSIVLGVSGIIPGTAGFFQRICLTMAYGWMIVVALRLGADRVRAAS